MISDSVWSEWTEPFDLFISYARADNAEPHMVSAIVEQIEADFARFSPSVPLKVFFDKKSILDMQDWQARLKKGLRQSKVMLAFLSENYFNSEWCRREWEEYLLVEQARTYPGEAFAPIFVIDPRQLTQRVPEKARGWWAAVTARNAVVEIHPYWTQGRDALQEEVVRQRLQNLSGTIQARVEYGRALAKVPRNLAMRNPNFVGRTEALAAIRDTLQRFDMVGLCAVNGVGGIGKSALAREYAYRFRAEYLGGQFEIDLSTVDDIRGVQSQLVSLAREYLNADIPPTEPEGEQFRRAKAAFEKRSTSEKVLLILDNLNEDATEVVGQTALSELPSPEKVHLLVTTRAEPRNLGGMEAITLDTLSTADALDLLFRYFPYARDNEDPEYQAARNGTWTPQELNQIPAEQEWKAALAIVNRLGRHSLAVTLVGAFLGQDDRTSYAKFYQQLDKRGIGLALEHVGNVKAVRNLVQHPVPLIRALFEKSVARLSPLCLRTLEYAAFLPSDQVPLTWLERLVKEDPDFDGEWEETFGSSPWEYTLTELAGLQYLPGAPYARMHRVVQDVVRQRMTDVSRQQREYTMLNFVKCHIEGNWDNRDGAANLEELAVLANLIFSRVHTQERLIGQSALWLVNVYSHLGRLRTALNLATVAQQILQEVAMDDPASTEKQRDLSLSFERLGDASVTAGNLTAARRYYKQAHDIHLQLAGEDPSSDCNLRDVCVSHIKLGDVSVTAGEMPSAWQHYQQAFELSLWLAADAPASAEKELDHSVSLERLGNVSFAIGDVPTARRCYEQALEIRRRHAADAPTSAVKQRGLAVLFNKLGEVSVEAQDLPAARHQYEQFLEISQWLATDDPASGENQRCLSISIEKLGQMSFKAGDLSAARGYLEQAIEIRRRLAMEDPASAVKQRDLSIVFRKFGALCAAEKNLTSARHFYEQALEISRQLAADDPASVEKQSDLSASIEGVGDLTVRAGKLAEARHFHEQALEIRLRLTADDPASVHKQYNLGSSYWKLCYILRNLGDASAARGKMQAFVDLWGRLETAGQLPESKDQAILGYWRERLVEAGHI